MKWLLGIKREIVILILIVLLGAFLRFYNLSTSVTFEFDEQYNSYLVYNLVKNHNPSLVGQEMSFGGMFLGPWHYLYLVPFYIATNLHPIGGFIGEGVIGLIAVISYYWIGRKLFNGKVGLVLALIRAVSIPLITVDRFITPPYPSELTSLWFIYFLVKLQEGSVKAFYFLSFLFGLMFTVHLSAFPLVIVWLVVMIVFRPIKLSLSLILKSLVLFLIPILPQIIFEVRHNFVHLLSLLKMLAEGKQSEYYLPYRLAFVSRVTFGNFIHQLVPSQDWTTGLPIFGMVVWTLFIQRYRLIKPAVFKIILLSFLIIPFYYIVYPRRISEYYLISLTPVTLILVGLTLYKLYRERLGKVLIVLFLILTVSPSIEHFIQNSVTHRPVSLDAKDKSVKSIVDHQRGKGDFSISYFMEYGREYGYQYFFTYYGLEPRKAVKPPVYSLVVPESQVAKKDLSEEFDNIGVIYPEKELQY